MLTTMSAAKRSKSDVRQFQESWTTDFGFVCRNERAVCTLCCENVVCRTSSIKRHFETKHQKSFKDDFEKNEALKKAVSTYEKQVSIFKKAIRCTNQTAESSYKVAECIAKRGKPFTDGDYIKEVLSIVLKFSLRICQIKKSFSQGLKICQCLLERLNDVLKTWLLT